MHDDSVQGGTNALQQNFVRNAPSCAPLGLAAPAFIFRVAAIPLIFAPAVKAVQLFADDAQFIRKRLTDIFLLNDFGNGLIAIRLDQSREALFAGVSWIFQYSFYHVLVPYGAVCLIWDSSCGHFRSYGLIGLTG
ncbi:hypothetical protein HMPREF1982_04184 [Clostridiales bacterium oral taxon 876 str. F0540]|nr:hypothetical protein HMPREF1982_04184 [Clostridiales bacterium oral taxon 876 str. F0540]